MKKFFQHLITAWKRGWNCESDRQRRQRALAATPAEIISRLQVLNNGYLPQTFLPATRRVRVLGFKLEQIADMATTAERDILAAFERGGDVRQGIADLHFVFKQYEKCFADLKAENERLVQASRTYAAQLEPFLP